MSTLSASNVSAVLGGRPVLENVSLTLTPGEVTAIVGPNGAGKSTLLNILAGLHLPRSGEAALDGTPLSTLKARERARRIGYLPQIADIAWPLDVRSLVALGLTPYLGRGRVSAVEGKAVDEALKEAGVSELADRRVDTLSGGERARVLLARAMVGDPEWLIADEPLAGLDPAHALEICAAFRRRAKRGHGVTLTLHDLTLAARAADRIVVLADGKILADGPPAQALTPGTLTRAYGVDARIIQGAIGPLVEIAALPANPSLDAAN